MGTIIVGTSGYSYRDWSGVFYPPQLSPRQYLSYYASVFSFTEINFTYYRQPRSDTIESIIASVPPDFRFSIKAHRSLTHEVEQTWKTDAAVFVEGIGPLLAGNRLLGVLLQFPYSFHYTKENRKYLSLLTDELAALPLFVEFRNDEWQKEQVYAELSRRGIGTVAVDEPDLPGLPSRIPPATSDRAYIRFHGRNREAWWTGDNASRYDYLYSPEELAEWVAPIRELASRTLILVIAFNNHYRGKAPRNALELTALLAGGPEEVK